MKIYQIYFEESQLAQCEHDMDGWFPYFNEKCSIFFESQVIHDLIGQGQHKDCDYFGVVSYKLRQKLGYMKENWKNNKNIANTSVNNFTPEQFTRELYKGMPDAMSFQRHAPHDPVIVADMFHPGFSKFWVEIMKKIGYKWTPTHCENVFYCQYFVAKAEIYEKFDREMLGPGMEVMLTMPELWGNSRYPRPWPDNLAKQFCVPHWTYHPFIAERFFSYFAQIHNLNCLHY